MKDDIQDLSHRWYAGETRALAKLMEIDATWIRGRASSLLNKHLRREIDAGDVAQEGLIRLLRFKLEHPPENLAEFRGLVEKVIWQVVIDRARRMEAACRIPAERFDMGNSALDRLVLEDPEFTPPPLRAERCEERERLVAALEQLGPEERWLIEQRVFQQRSHGRIAELLGITEGAASMRFYRAIQALERLHGPCPEDREFT